MKKENYMDQIIFANFSLPLSLSLSLSLSLPVFLLAIKKRGCWIFLNARGYWWNITIDNKQSQSLEDSRIQVKLKRKSAEPLWYFAKLCAKLYKIKIQMWSCCWNNVIKFERIFLPRVRKIHFWINLINNFLSRSSWIFHLFLYRSWESTLREYILLRVFEIQLLQS